MKEEESFRDKISTIDSSGKRAWLNPLKPKGRLYDLRKYTSYFYLLIFFGLPFIKVGGNPLFLINILERKFILFGTVFWPQDMFIFGLGMVIFIVFIALFLFLIARNIIKLLFDRRQNLLGSRLRPNLLLILFG